jgi:hypothetical protein
VIPVYVADNLVIESQAIEAAANEKSAQAAKVMAQAKEAFQQATTLSNALKSKINPKLCAELEEVNAILKADEADLKQKRVCPHFFSSRRISTCRHFVFVICLQEFLIQLRAETAALDEQTTICQAERQQKQVVFYSSSMCGVALLKSL